MGKTKGKFSRKLLQITIGPLVLAGILVLLITYIGIYIEQQKECIIMLIYTTNHIHFKKEHLINVRENYCLRKVVIGHL